MKKIFFILTAFCGMLFLHACSTNIPVEKTLAGYQYPIAQTLAGQYPLDRHYAISVFDEGEGGGRRITVTPSEQNEIGSKDSVTDENLFVLDGKLLLYASFYDDWTIRQSVQIIFDDEGNAVRTLTVTYNPDGKPVSLKEETL